MNDLKQVSLRVQEQENRPNFSNVLTKSRLIVLNAIQISARKKLSCIYLTSKQTDSTKLALFNY